ncbi:MAG: metalloregulator ArsR/SmtB family transcription factor [Acidobacteriota bacterium]
MVSSGLNRTYAITRALGNPVRLRVLAMLGSGELCACQIIEVLGLAPSTVSAHLRELKLVGLIGERKQGKWVYASLQEEPEAARWIALAVRGLKDDPQIAADASMVDELRRLPVEDLCHLGRDAAAAKHAATRPPNGTSGAHP